MNPDQEHVHDVVFIGIVNINREGCLQGVVDVHRCRLCRRLFCEDGRFGEPLLMSIGFEEPRMTSSGRC